MQLKHESIAPGNTKVKQIESCERLLNTFKQLISQLKDNKLNFEIYCSEFLKTYEQYKADVDTKGAYYPLSHIYTSIREMQSGTNAWNRRPPREEEIIKWSVETDFQRFDDELLDRKTRKWVEDNLIDRGYLSFHKELGNSTSNKKVSKFGNETILYYTPIMSSFLLTALNNIFKPCPFTVNQLLRELCNACNDEKASWIYITEPDGAITILEGIWSFGNVYEQEWCFELLEKEPAAEGGPSFLFLLPESRAWALLFERSEGFSITFHGQEKIAKKLLKALQMGN